MAEYLSQSDLEYASLCLKETGQPFYLVAGPTDGYICNELVTALTAQRMLNRARDCEYIIARVVPIAADK